MVFSSLKKCWISVWIRKRLRAFRGGKTRTALCPELEEKNKNRRRWISFSSDGRTLRATLGSRHEGRACGAENTLDTFCGRPRENKPPVRLVERFRAVWLRVKRKTHTRRPRRPLALAPEPDVYYEPFVRRSDRFSGVTSDVGQSGLQERAFIRSQVQQVQRFHGMSGDGSRATAGLRYTFVSVIIKRYVRNGRTSESARGRPAEKTKAL